MRAFASSGVALSLQDAQQVPQGMIPSHLQHHGQHRVRYSNDAAEITGQDGSLGS